MAKALRLADRGGAAARLIGACTSGAALALALAPFHFIWLVPLCLGLIGRQALSLEGWKQGAFYGWLLGTSYFAVAMVWIYEPFQIDAERYAWMAPFAVVGLAAGLALFWAAAFAAATKWGQEWARRSRRAVS